MSERETHFLQGVESEVFHEVIPLFQVKGMEQGYIRPTGMDCIRDPKMIIRNI